MKLQLTNPEYFPDVESAEIAFAPDLEETWELWINGKYFWATGEMPNCKSYFGDCFGPNAKWETIE